MKNYDDAVSLLRAAGWSEDREVSADRQLEALRADGYEPWGELCEFLQHFGELCLLVPDGDNTDEILLDAAESTRELEPLWAEVYSQRAGTSVAPIGLANRRHLFLFLAADGRILGAVDDFLGELGGTIFEAIHQLRTSRSFKTIL